MRIEVNGELDALAPAIDAAIEQTDVGGRIAVLSYHSGEDRIVKERMRLAVTGGCTCPPELPCVCDAVQTVRIVRGLPRTPRAAEQDDNRRAAAHDCVSSSASPTHLAVGRWAEPWQPPLRSERLGSCARERVHSDGGVMARPMIRSTVGIVSAPRADS